MLGENTSCIRYWSDSFPKFIKPYRNAKGNRMFKTGDIETLKQIQFLVNSRGLRLDGVEKVLSEDRSSVDKTIKAITTLKEIRERLVEVRNLI